MIELQSGAEAFVGMAIGALAAGLCAAVAIPFARASGWLDGARDAGEAARKKQELPVPPIGGAAILFGLAVQFACGFRPFPASGASWLAAPAEAWCFGALAAAFCVGLLDDLLPGGLRPRAKLLGQAAVGLLLSLPSYFAASPSEALGDTALWIAAVWVATNLWNTFDNADGAATGVGGAGLAAAASPAAGPLLGFLPWNLARRHGRRAPCAYLGDSGSHLLGVLVLLQPAAWPAMLLPALDLARLSGLRWRRGSRPWRGDRRHLAHRLEARGMAPMAVFSTLLALAAPAILWPAPGGVLVTSALFLLAVRLTSDPDAESSA